MIFKILGFVCASLSLHFLGTAVPIVVWCFLFCPYLLITQWSIAETVSSLTFSLCSLWLNSSELKSSSSCCFPKRLTVDSILNGFYIKRMGSCFAVLRIYFYYKRSFFFCRVQSRDSSSLCWTLFIKIILYSRKLRNSSCRSSWRSIYIVCFFATIRFGMQ